MTGIRSQAEVKDFSSSLCVHTSSEVYPTTYPMGTEGPFPGLKRSQGKTLTTYHHLVLRSRINRRYASSPPCCLNGSSGKALLFPYTTFRQRLSNVIPLQLLHTKYPETSVNYAINNLQISYYLQPFMCIKVCW
jgi:hypothetical protein